MENIVTSPFKDIPIPEVLLTDFIIQRLTNHGDLMSMVEPHTGRKYTFNQLIENIKKAASGFSCHGVKKGDVVFIISPNDIDIGVAFLALASIGAITTTANPASTTREIKIQLEETAAAYIICAPDTAETIKEVVKEFPAIIVYTFGNVDGLVSFSDLLSFDEDGQLLAMVEQSPEDIILVLLSSGTTGIPKAIGMCHRIIVAQVLSWSSPDVALERDPSSPGSECLIMSFPFRHAFGFVVVFLEALYCGNQLVVMKEFNFKAYLDLISTYKATVLHMTLPSVMAFIKDPIVDNYDFSHIHAINCAGSPISKTATEQLAARIGVKGIRQAYGLTEALALTLGSRTEWNYGSVGLLLPNVKAKILDTENHLSLGPYKKGEICIRSPCVFKCYFKQSETTENNIDKDGWLKTGDIGYYDEDGRLFIVDRLKNLIKYNGFQVSPAELENLLMTHPAVVDAAVIGVPDEIAGELPKAFIVRKKGVVISKEDLTEFVEANVSPVKYLRGGIQFVETVPKNATGKILYRSLRDKY